MDTDTYNKLREAEEGFDESETASRLTKERFDRITDKWDTVKNNCEMNNVEKNKSIGSNLSRSTRRKAERFLKKNERAIDEIYDKALDESDFDYKKEGGKYFFPDQDTVNKATILRQSISFQYLKDNFKGIEFKV